VVTVNDNEGRGDRGEEPAPGQQPALPVTPLATDDAVMPAAWYPDPIDSASFRYWDGVAWTRLTRPVPPPTPVSAGETPSAPSDEVPSINLDVAPLETPATDVQTEGAENRADDASVGHEEPADHWVREAGKAVATAWTVGTPSAWRNAARAAVVVAEIAQTMRMTTYARQIAQQLGQTAEEAALHAQSAQQAAGDAMRMAEQTALAAEEAAQAARVAVQVALNARQNAEQMGQAAPNAVESAQLAAQASATATATADHLDQIVIKAREANTPEAWSDALQIAAEACGDGDRLHVVSARPDIDESLEGWYTDPYSRHEARWMSHGTPSPLVRDGSVEAHDPAPDEPFTVTPVRVGDDVEPNEGSDLRRADDVERGPTYDPQKAARQAWDAYDQSDAQS